MKNSCFFILAILLLSNIIHAQIITFSDVNFKAKLLEADESNSIAEDAPKHYFKIDANSDGEIQISEAETVIALNLYFSGITNLAGIENFSNLLSLDVGSNYLPTISTQGLDNLILLGCDSSQVSSIDLSYAHNLQFLSCNENLLTSLSFEGVTDMINISCSNNNLQSLDVSGFPNLNAIYCQNNQLESLNLSGAVGLHTLYCPTNELTELNLSGLTNIETLNCANNSIVSLDVTGFVHLREFMCYENELTSLTLSGLPELRELQCSDNHIVELQLNDVPGLLFLSAARNDYVTLDLTGLPNNMSEISVGGEMLQSVFMQNGHNDPFYLWPSPSLLYVCADSLEADAIQAQLIDNGNIFGIVGVGSDCDFTPQQPLYSLNGKARYNGNNDNSCDALDLNYANLMMAVTNGNTTGNLITNADGDYLIPVTSGAYTLTPLPGNPAYFNVSPANATVTFPETGSPFTQNFCITANGLHPDLEISLLPLDPLRPGFDAKYKISYRNKGTQAQSGSLLLAYDGSVLDFVYANPVLTSQSGEVLQWDFSDLLPFETRAIVVTLNANTPMEIPALNGGDILNFTASVNSSSTDETPTDNTFILDQTVVNSFDPNDKTCLEGNTITPEMVGKEVHYLIRFENTGTANAENIVVKDMIDTAKFDINSLIPIDGSHPFVTKISNTNKVEFIFENIQLPFDDANNDGYVAFKIKTKPTLVVGNSFSNTAGIYFDYNFPIITNTATTTVALLANQDFAFEDYFKIYPNPANDVLNIESKQTIEVTSINIYNTLGQIVLVIPNAQQTKSVDVSSLKAGHYFLKINSDKGSSNVKFVRM